MSKNTCYTAATLLDYFHYQEYYKLIGTDLSRQTSTNIFQPIKNTINPSQLFILLTSYTVLDYHFEKVISSIYLC